jgi:transcriptional regulator with XRE-family HTH domain
VNNAAEIEIYKNPDVLANNIQILLKEHGVTENEVAQSINIPVMTIRRLASGETTDPRISTLRLIAGYFGISVDALVENGAPRSLTLTGKAVPYFIPVLEWKKAETINSIKEIDLKLWGEWYPIALFDQYTLSNEAFALESRPSMQPRFPIGTLFVIEPDASPTDGDIVLVRMKVDGSLSLRELVIDSPSWQLQPIIAGSETLFYNADQHIIAGIVVLTLLHTRKEKQST